MSKIEKVADISRIGILGEILFFQVFMCYALVALGFLVSIPPNLITFPSALCAGLVLLYCRGTDTRGMICLFIATLVCWAITIPATAFLVDDSYDGNAYHQEIIAALCRGWLPGGSEITGVPLSIWSLHYAKGIEMAEAAVVSFTGIIESGKAVNLIMGMSVAALVYGFITDNNQPIGKPYRCVLALVAVSNPVFLSQAYSFYIDYAKYFYTLISILLIIKISKKPQARSNYVLLGSVICMAIATKFNSFFEEGVTILAALIWLYSHKSFAIANRLLLTSVISTLTGVFLLAYHPYVTNLIEAGNPLYPLLGEGSIDIMTGNTPAEYLDSDRFTNFFRSMVTLAYPMVDQRQGGFGILMFPMILMACYFIVKSRHKWNGLGMYIALWILASCFFFEQSWWARYIPQLWLIIVEGVYLAIAGQSNKRVDIVMLWLTICFVALTAIVTFGKNLSRNIRQTCYRAVVTSELKGREVKVLSLNEAYLRQMKEKGINAIPASQDDVTRFQLPYYGLLSDPEHYPILQLDSVTKTCIVDRLEELPFDFSENLDPNP